jgi:hypothetical protein
VRVGPGCQMSPPPLESIATIFPLPFPRTASMKEIEVGRGGGVMGPARVPQRRRLGCKGAILVDIPWSDWPACVRVDRGGCDD